MGGTKSFTDAEAQYIGLAFLLLLFELICHPPDAFKESIENFDSVFHDSWSTVYLLAEYACNLAKQINLNDVLKINEL